MGKDNSLEIASKLARIKATAMVLATAAAHHVIDELEEDEIAELGYLIGDLAREVEALVNESFSGPAPSPVPPAGVHVN
jgi:hypothetical protein